MSLKHILVHVDDDTNVDSRLGVALRLAVDHDTHVTGLYVVAPPYIPSYMAGHVTTDLFDTQRQLADETMRRASARFEAVMKSESVSFESLAADGSPADKISELARYADLVVIAQPDDDQLSTGDPARDLPGEVILESGRPVMVVPYAGTFDHIGESVMVMWNASREAARAIADALPILEKARHVNVVSVNPGRETEDIGDLPGADIAHQLARHGVRVETAPTYSEDVEIGEIILSRAFDMSADLIVMGGYGRSRFREMILGGATRSLLESMTVPVFFSH